MTESSQSESSLRLAHQHAQQYMQSGDFDVAVEILEELLGQEPDNTQALYLLAVCLRKQKNYDRARDNLDKLIGHKQNYGHAYQELGHLETERNDLPSAIKFYQRAIQINPALHGAWRALSTFKDYPQRAEALRQVQWFDSLPAELKSVSSFLHQGQLKKAESLCRVFLQRQPHHPEAMRLLAQLSIKFNHLEDAEVLLSKCIEFAPKHYQAHIDLIEVLHRRQKYVKALDHAYSLNETDPQNTAFIICLANALQATGDYKAAIEKYRHALTLLPHNPSVQVALGNALKTSGGVKQAIQAYRSAYETDAGCGEAYWSLANLKTYPFSQNELKNMKEQIARPELPPLELARLHFALGKAYEDQKDFRQSFQHYNDGNKIKRQEQPFDLSRLKEDLAFQKQHFNQDFFAQRQGFGCNADDPIFILGMPRAGSTLLEQILASHSQVDGTMELANIIAYAHRLSPKEASLKKHRYPSTLAQLTAEQASQLGKIYLKETKAHRLSAPYFIDKMPNNFRHIALIKLILPNAKIIDARREPMACCFSVYKQLFAEGQEFSYCLSDIANYYQEYVRVMDHWDEVFPGQILRVQHEDVLDDLTVQVKRILSFCGLPFEQNCVDYHTNERAVKTPSSEQVRQPIFKSSKEQWRNFDDYLSPLKDAFMNDN